MAQLEFLRALPPKFERMHRQIEEIASLHAGEAVFRSLAQMLESLRHEAQGLTLGALADTFGLMALLTRRGGGLQMRVRGLREGLVSLKANYEGALRAASRPREGQAPAAPEGGR